MRLTDSFFSRRSRLREERADIGAEGVGGDTIREGDAQHARTRSDYQPWRVTDEYGCFRYQRRTGRPGAT